MRLGTTATQTIGLFRQLGPRKGTAELLRMMRRGAGPATVGLRQRVLPANRQSPSSGGCGRVRS